MQEFIHKVKLAWEQKSKVDLLKEQLEEASKKMEGLKLDVMKMMEAGDLQKFPLPGYGTVYRQQSFSVKTPKTPQDKEKLFTWIKETKGEDVLDNLLSINSMTLNSLFKEELEQAKERGDVNWAMPGVGVPEVYYKLGMRNT